MLLADAGRAEDSADSLPSAGGIPDAAAGEAAVYGSLEAVPDGGVSISQDGQQLPWDGASWSPELAAGDIDQIGSVAELTVPLPEDDDANSMAQPVEAAEQQDRECDAVRAEQQLADSSAPESNIGNEHQGALSAAEAPEDGHAVASGHGGSKAANGLEAASDVFDHESPLDTGTWPDAQNGEPGETELVSEDRLAAAKSSDDRAAVTRPMEDAAVST